MTRKIDFTTYSLDDLYLSAEAVDREKPPDIAKEIDRLILEKEKREPVTHHRKLSADSIYSNAIFRIIFCMLFAISPAIFFSSVFVYEALQFIITPIFVVAFGLVFFKLCFRDTADLVYDEGDALLFITNDKQQRVELKDIIRVRHVMRNRSLIRVQIKNDGGIESELMFEPKVKSKLCTISPLVKELNRRAMSARRTR
ncbi:hypothetical protein J8M21_00565 [Pseudoalteromonas luteoviolacea]|uniref:hypothetical protein n=1 Tax=Pseudoalteromonas luteoviolacea TaxID=43657 RepID=UPI001B377B20|nr:hypothetical protein [Pseudoalteromonas luteoviolacea]MBQ4875691.1 hypothetical protein [Pseudoalteromonas luteoviolacea]MBQ4904726.1 hypothetical protein [Pseudoalteromonas luteoviolacea]